MTDQQAQTQRLVIGFLLVVIIAVGVSLIFVIDRGNDAVNRQAAATEDLVVATGEVARISQLSLDPLEVGRYERIKFQIEQRELVCLDLQDGDTDATPVQAAECAEDYITLPPKPEGYPG